MKETKPKELRDKSQSELEQMLAQEREALYRARRDLVFRKISDTAGLKSRRHNIARLLTVLTEMKGGAA